MARLRSRPRQRGGVEAFTRDVRDMRSDISGRLEERFFYPGVLEGNRAVIDAA
jgi:hypothetical protein